MSKSDFVLYQWPGTNYIESIYPRCVIFHRLFNLLNFEFTIKNLDLAQFDNDVYNSKINNVLKLFPILRYQNHQYSTTNEIISFLLSHFENTETIHDVKKYGMAYNVIVSEWANQVFLYTLLYARWIRERNYRKFISSVNWETVPTSRQIHEDRQDILRELVVKHIKTTPTGVLKYEEYYARLISQLFSLEKLLQHQDYIVLYSDHLTISDLVVFMVIQGLLDENLEESSVIKNDFPYIMNWYTKIDSQTKNESL